MFVNCLRHVHAGRPGKELASSLPMHYNWRRDTGDSRTTLVFLSARDSMGKRIKRHLAYISNWGGLS